MDGSGFLDLRVGDAVSGVAGASPIFTPGPSRWYALRVQPQREDQVEAWLHLRGVYGFHPVLVRQAQRYGKVREYHRRYLPGYVFGRFRGEALVHRVMSCPWIIGALCRSDGEWGVLEPNKLRAIHIMRKIDAEQRKKKAAALARRIAAGRLRAGESAMFSVGAFSGFQCEVVELVADGGVIVRLEVFGREALVTATAGSLEPLCKAGVDRRESPGLSCPL